MSELTNNGAAIRLKLLTGVSALALTAYISSANLAKAEDADRPVLWMELGGQFDFVGDSAQSWVPSNLPPPVSHLGFGPLGEMPRIGYELNGKISVQPAGSDWNFSAAIQYGKAKHGPKATHDQTYASHVNVLGIYAPVTYAFIDTHSLTEAKHVILDFQAGKDLGLGLFGGHGSSAVNLGVRVAQFREKADASMTAAISAPAKYIPGPQRDAEMRNARSFSGVGPSLAWKASAPLSGSLADGVALDWGMNVALLFGRQKTEGQLHAKEAKYRFGTGRANPIVHTQSTTPISRKKQVMVPNIGGFAGLSYRVHGDAKISFGYRADIFFNAIDGGIGTRKSVNRSFHGPYAGFSIGVGD